jgi:hypothetical protein
VARGPFGYVDGSSGQRDEVRPMRHEGWICKAHPERPWAHRAIAPAHPSTGAARPRPSSASPAIARLSSSRSDHCPPFSSVIRQTKTLDVDTLAGLLCGRRGGRVDPGMARELVAHRLR